MKVMRTVIFLYQSIEIAIKFYENYEIDHNFAGITLYEGS